MPTSQINPVNALLLFRERLDLFKGEIIGPDQKPIHWLVKQAHNGLLLTDSALWLQGLGFGGINMEVKHKMEDRSITNQEMGEMLIKLLDWLAMNLPRSRDWGVEFRDGCPVLECGREVIG